MRVSMHTLVMELFELYLIQTACLILPLLAFWLVARVFKDKIKNFDLVKTWTMRGFAILGIVFILLAYFFNTNAMRAQGGTEAGTIDPNVGCVDLIGVPYGNNRFLNFLAWLGSALMHPAALIALFTIIFPSKIGKIINRIYGWPIALLEFATLFNICYANNGNCNLMMENIFFAVQGGLVLACTIMLRIDAHEETREIHHKEFFYALGMFGIALFACLPSYTLSSLFSTDGILFGEYQINLRVYDLKLPHRMSLYFIIFLNFFLYFTIRDAELNFRKTMVMVISLGCLLLFFTDYGANDIFYIDSLGKIQVHVGSLPIHLCHTALYVVPICVVFNMKRFFYFTYFINVFGAIMAMMMPNTGENLNIYLPAVMLFWYNHFAAFSTPLLCVALGVFEKPKFKQMLWSLLFFLLYFLIIMFLNAWLSNYIDGYNPDVMGSGTDFLFINDDFIASKILNAGQVTELLGKVVKWQWGSLVFVLRPPYQTIFFLVYVAVAFGMWFVYSLFFRIADSHKDLRNMLIVARKENITMKERRRIEALNEENSRPDEVSLVFEHFSKRYGNSPVLSAKDVNLTVHGGTIFGFLGPNGAGKSTCIKSAIGIQPVTEGHIFVCGYDTTTESVKSKREIGYVPDHYALYEKLTGREYINYIADLYGVSKEDRDERIAKYVNLFELNQAFDNRMQTYSHGMKQKMTIIAALVHNPKVWILDEPLTGLDPQSIFQVKQCMIQHAKEGNIVFFSSHIIDVVEKLCTEIAIIRKGQIVYQSSMEQIEKEHPEGLESFYLSMIHDNGDLDEN